MFWYITWIKKYLVSIRKDRVTKTIIKETILMYFITLLEVACTTPLHGFTLNYCYHRVKISYSFIFWYYKILNGLKILQDIQGE